MKRSKIISCTILLLALSVLPGIAATQALNVPELTQDITKVEKQEVILTGTILGACTSGCKIWVGEDKYRKGDPYVLVWAKDDAFKFKTDATGAKVQLKGYAVGKYIDLCATEKKQQEEMKEGESCPLPANLNEQKVKQLQSITFFATDVEYL